MEPWDWHKSVDEEDVATLEPFSDLPESDVLKIILPDAQHRGVKSFRCCRKDTFVKFSQNVRYPRWAHATQGATTVAFLPTPLVGVELSEYDTDFVLRCIAESLGSARAVVLHAAHIHQIAPEHVKDPVNGIVHDNRQEVVVHLHHIEEAEKERILWQMLDSAMTAFSQGRCPKGHNVTVINARGAWVCDGCESHFTRAAQPRRCLMGCDFDLCESCMRRTSSEDASARLSQFEVALRSTGSVDGMLYLPRLPPREMIWQDGSATILRVSQRVTKWNAVSLDPEISARIRHTFLRALGVVQASDQWLCFQPGTGRPMRVVRMQQGALESLFTTHILRCMRIPGVILGAAILVHMGVWDFAWRVLKPLLMLFFP